MKTERRHELQENALASYLERAVKQSGPYLRIGIWVVVAAVAVLVIVQFLVKQSRARAQEGWEAMQTAQLDEQADDPVEDRLRGVASQYSNSDIAPWARLSAAQAEFTQGFQAALFGNTEQALPLINSAVEDCETAKQSSEGMLQQIATFRLGLAYESLGNVEKAIEQYESVTGALEDYAQARVEQLKEPETQEFYAWYKQNKSVSPLLDQDPEFGDPGLPEPGLPDPRLPGLPGSSLDFDVDDPGGDAKVPASGEPKPGQDPPSLDDILSRDIPPQGAQPDPAEQEAPAAGEAESPDATPPKQSTPQPEPRSTEPPDDAADQDASK